MKPRLVTQFIVLLGILFPTFVYGQVKQAYSLFNAEGRETSYGKMIQSLEKADVVFFGELHNNTLAHWLELQLLKDLHTSGTRVIVGMEMFESDDQTKLNEYLKGLIEEKNFLKEAKIWDNYKTDYRPIVEYAKRNHIHVVATNVPRRYANLVYRKGLPYLDSLGNESYKWIAPLPLTVDFELPSYKAMVSGMGEHRSGSAQNLVGSQALKDATMAHFIAVNLNRDGVFYHINGSYHSQDYEGIIPYLKKTNPGLNIITIHVVEQSSIERLDDKHLKKADYIFCIVDDIIKSY